MQTSSRLKKVVWKSRFGKKVEEEATKEDNEGGEVPNTKASRTNASLKTPQNDHSPNETKEGPDNTTPDPGKKAPVLLKQKDDTRPTFSLGWNLSGSQESQGDIENPESPEKNQKTKNGNESGLMMKSRYV